MNKDQKQFRKLAREAVKLYRKEEWSASIIKWDALILLLQDGNIKANAYARRGNAKNKMGDYEGAIADCDRALEIRPQYARAYNNRGNAKSNMGDYEGAIADYDRAIEISPQYTMAYSNRGITKRKMGDYKGAIADYDRAIEISPQYTIAYSNRGVAKSNMGDYEGAIADYDRAIEISPQYAAAYSNRGITKDNMGDHAGAIADFDWAIGINPQFADAYSNRGVTKRKMGDYKDAIADYDRAIEINPNHKSAIHNRAIALVLQDTQKEHEELRAKYQAQAKEAFNRTLKISTDLIDTKEYEDARVEYEKEARNRGKWVWGLSFMLAGLAAAFYGIIAYLGFKEWQVAQSPMAMRSFSPLSLFPFVLMATLALSPLAWVIRMLNRDKHKYWVLREDAVATRKMLLIIKTGHEKREDLWLQLFDHHDKRGGAHLIADWNHSDGGGNNFTINPGGGNP